MSPILISPELLEEPSNLPCQQRKLYLNTHLVPMSAQKTDAMLKLACTIVGQRKLSNTDLVLARASGLTEGEIVEIVADVVLKTFSDCDRAARIESIKKDHRF